MSSVIVADASVKLDHEGTGRAGRSRTRGTRSAYAFALAIFLVPDFVYFASGTIGDLAHRCACAPGTDPETYMWFLSWWPHALLHGSNPLSTAALFAPDHLNLGAVTLLPAVSVLTAPITLTLGPLVTYNLLALAAPLAAAMAMFALARHLTGRWLPALAAGYVFGFSPYMLGHMMGHLDLVLVFPIPLLVLVALRYGEGSLSRRRATVLSVLLFTFQYLSSPELTLTLVIVAGSGLVLAAALVPARRLQVRAIALLTLGAGLVAVVLVSPFIVYALTGDVSEPFFATFGHLGADALGLAVPTSIVRLGRAWFLPVSARFPSGLSESGVYLGIPLLLILGRYVITRWNRREVRVLTVLFGLVFALALGTRLHIAGYETMPVPLGWLHHVPLLSRTLPSRYGVYLYLIAAVILALWLAERRSRTAARWKWALAAVAVLTLLPNLGGGFWKSQPSNPTFFASDAYRQVIHRGEVVLVLPWGQQGYSMLWQAETGFWFRMAGGYVGALLPPDYVADPARPGIADAAASLSGAQLHDFLRRRHVGAVVVDSGSAGAWPDKLAAAGLHGRPIAGVDFYPIT